MERIEFLEEGIDLSPLLQVCLESEMTWNNIFIESCESEFNAIITEDVSLLNESISDTVQKIIQWIKDKIRDLKKVAGNILRELRAKLTDINKMIKFGECIEGKNYNVEVVMRDWNFNNFNDVFMQCIKDMDTVDDIGRDIMKKMKPSNFTDKTSLVEEGKRNIEEISSKYNINKYPSMFLKSDKISKKVVSADIALRFLTNYQNQIDYMKDALDDLLEFLEDSYKDFNGNKNNEEYINKATSLKKLQISTMEKINTYFLNIQFKYLADCIKVIRVAVTEYKSRTNG